MILDPNPSFDFHPFAILIHSVAGYHDMNTYDLASAIFGMTYHVNNSPTTSESIHVSYTSYASYSRIGYATSAAWIMLLISCNMMVPRSTCAIKGQVSLVE
jgi:hypothetical protein